jgi:hypothetical protein
MVRIRYEHRGIPKGWVRDCLFLMLPRFLSLQIFRMSIKASTHLLQLAGQSLLRNEVLAISVVETAHAALPSSLHGGVHQETH